MLKDDRIQCARLRRRRVQGYRDLSPLGRRRRRAVGTFYHALNFSAYDHDVNVPFSTNGVWQDLLNSGEYFVANYRLAHHLINSNWGKVFYRKK